MIVLTNKYYSGDPVEVIADELERSGIIDFEVSPRISKQNVTINTDLSNLKIYIPPSRNYDQYSIESYIRRTDPTNRASAERIEDYVVMTYPRPIRLKTYIGLVNEIIELDGFCTILME